MQEISQKEYTIADVIDRMNIFDNTLERLYTLTSNAFDELKHSIEERFARNETTQKVLIAEVGRIQDEIIDLKRRIDPIGKMLGFQERDMKALAAELAKVKERIAKVESKLK